MASPVIANPAVPTIETTTCSCTRLLFAACNHAELLKSTKCQLSVHKPQPENILVWEETCVEAHQHADFIIPICQATDDPVLAAQVQYGKVVCDSEEFEIPIVQTELCVMAESDIVSPSICRVRFQLPHSNDFEWEPRTSPTADLGRNQDLYEEITQRFNATRREISKVREMHSKELWSIDLEIFCAEKRLKDDPQPDSVDVSALYEQRHKLLKEGREKLDCHVDILHAKLKTLRTQRELTTCGVLSACASRYAGRRK